MKFSSLTRALSVKPAMSKTMQQLGPKVFIVHTLMNGVGKDGGGGGGEMFFGIGCESSRKRDT